MFLQTSFNFQESVDSQEDQDQVTDLQSMDRLLKSRSSSRPVTKGTISSGVSSSVAFSAYGSDSVEVDSLATAKVSERPIASM
jgi:hypothetical protein